MSGFKKFLLRGNVVELAVAVVIGAAFGAVVAALVRDFITPLIGAFGGVPDFSTVGFTINNSHFAIGDFINALLAFLVIAVVVYFFVILPIERLSSASGNDAGVPVLLEQNSHQSGPLRVLHIRRQRPRRRHDRARNAARAVV